MTVSLRWAAHLLLHLIVPGAAARLLFPQDWRRAWMVMLATMLVDLDHLFASPIVDPDRCSIGFDPLHTGPAIVAYGVIALIPKLRLVGLGLLLHMLLDALDCAWMTGPRAMFEMVMYGAWRIP